MNDRLGSPFPNCNFEADAVVDVGNQRRAGTVLEKMLRQSTFSNKLSLK